MWTLLSFEKHTGITFKLRISSAFNHKAKMLVGFKSHMFYHLITLDTLIVMFTLRRGYTTNTNKLKREMQQVEH